MPRRPCSTLALVAALGLLTPLVATGESDAPRMEEEKLVGPQVALSVGVGAGAGYVYKHGTNLLTGQPEDLKVTDASSVSLPILLEVGYRGTPHWYFGLWGSWEKVFTKNSELSCPDGFDCNFRQWRFGPEARYHFRPGSGFDPWAGLGVGLEITQSDLKGDVEVPTPGGGTVPASVKLSITDRGPTYARLTLGGDVRLTRNVFLGPIITASIGSYTIRTGEQSVTLPGIGTSTTPLPPVDDGFHGLFTVALRVAWLKL
ncbi:hypothetical protein JY651_13455 [Pyxidicoccus parkwayensis]|uniref:Outer membrane protein beta-barrel domain-containing protein n=1 Tax=Pyxidicoccus parkwayensis TaxID=2813578 RepID=A0ABX7P5X4_9BACT|nr:hypothetical protein [Pyxidicoccus parkwaysis]QSQ25866.1 hypothetical protein JY651_13455 [Pyxidicoccus parkwaysis]